MPGYDHLQLGIDVTGADRSADNVRRLNEAIRTGAELTLSAGRQTVEGLARTERAFASATRESHAFTAVQALMIAGVVKGAPLLAHQATQVDNLANSYRALRLAMSPTAFTAGTIGAGIALEVLVRNAEKYARINREISLEAARTGTTFQDVLAKRTAARIEGGDFADVFSGKSISSIRTLVTEYNKLADPVDKAAFAVENFGAKAEKAMPMLRMSMLDSLDSAEKFAAGMTKLDRESLERFSNRLHEIPDALHRIAAGFRDIMNTGFMRWMALAVAHTADTIGKAPTVNQIQGIDAAPQMPSFGAVAGQKANAEWFIRAMLMTIPVESGTLSRSDAAMADYYGSAEGLQGKLEAAESRRLRYLGQLRPGAGSALGTNLEQTVRTSLLQVQQEIAGYRASIKAIEDREKAIKDLAVAQKELNAAMEAFNAFDTLGGKPQTRTEQLKTLLDPFSKYGSAYGLGERLKATQAASEAMAEFDVLDMGGARKLETSAERTRRIMDPFGMFGAGAGIRGAIDRGVADQEAALRSLRLEASFAERIVELRAGPGGELDAARQTARIRQQAIEREYAMTGDLNAYREESRRNEMEFQVRLAEFQRQRIENLRSEMGGLFDAIMGGKSGLQQFAFGQLRNLGRAAFSNTATSLITGSKITAQSTFGGTWLGDMLGGQANPLKISTDANTAATIANTQALTALAMSPSGGGGGLYSPASNFARLVLGGDFAGTDAPPSDYLGGGDWGDGTYMPAKTGTPKFATYARYGASAAGAGVGIYGVVTSPSTKGKLASGGGALIAAAPMTGPAAPFVAAAGAVLEVASMFIRDPKQVRAEELERDRQARAFNMPSGYDYAVDTRGRSYDFDYTGRMRPIIQVTNNFQVIDPPNFVRWAKENPDAISEATTHSLYNDGGQFAAAISQVSA